MSKRLTRRVLLIGWDAADWHIAGPLMEAGTMPVLARLVGYGTSGKLSTLQPALSPILWNSIATGKRADKHGILGFAEPAPDGQGVRPVTSTSRRAKALWNILSQRGLRSSVVNWFASDPAEPIAGTIFSNRISNDVFGPDGGLLPMLPAAVHPPGLLQTAEDLRIHPSEVTPRQVLAFFNRKHPPDPEDPRFLSLVKMIAQCASTHNAATWLAARDDWDLLAVYYDTIDHIGHTFIEYHPPAMAHVEPEDAAIWSEIVTKMYRYHDMMLGTLIDAAGSDSTVILLSDHGFYSDHLRPAVAEHFRVPEKKFGPQMNPVSWHRPHGMFVAAGKCIKHDELLHGAGLLDIAPTVLTLLGLPVADDMDGKALTQLFIEPIQPECIASYEPPHPHDGVHRNVPTGEGDPFAARQALQQLANLGYVELPEDGDMAKAVAETDRDRRQNLAQVYFSTGRTQEAIELHRGLLAEQENSEGRCNLALCLVGIGRSHEAEEVLQLVPAEKMTGPLPQLILGQIRLAEGRLDEALAILEPLARQELPQSYIHLTLGQMYQRRGLLPEAEVALRRALDRDEENAIAHDHLGTVLFASGRYEDAIYEHMRSAALQHARPMTHAHLGMALARTGQFDWAIRAFEIAVELAPKYAFAHRCLVRLYRRVKGDQVKAREHLERLVELRAQRRAATLS